MKELAVIRYLLCGDFLLCASSMSLVSSFCQLAVNRGKGLIWKQRSQE